jgi:two-component system, chemotaxis family, chemotaxis protein CheY
MQNLIKRTLGANEAEPPPQPDPVAAAVAAAKAAQREPAAPQTCLVVDDSRMIRKVARRIAEGLGYSVVEAENGEEAIARCKVAMPDLVLTDWDMPVMTGPDFVAALRALPGGAASRVVFCTSMSGVHDIHRGIAAGADDYVVKPFDEATVAAKLRGLGI